MATNQQRTYLSPGCIKYNKRLDNNAGGSFTEISILEFLTEIDKGRGREIEEEYDI